MSLSRRSKSDVLERRSYLVGDLANRLGVSRRTIERIIKDRHVEVIRIRRSVRVPESEVEKILRSSADPDAS